MEQGGVNHPPIEIYATKDAVVADSDDSEMQLGLDSMIRVALLDNASVAKSLVKFNLSGVGITPSSAGIL